MTKPSRPSVDDIRAMIIELTTVTSMMHTRADEVLAPLDQNLLRFQILSHYAQEPITVSQVSRNLHVSRQYVQRVTNELRARGHVTALDNPAHRRSPLFTATELGRQEDAAAIEAVSPWVRFLSERVDHVHLDRLRDSLRILGAAARSFEADGGSARDQTP